MPTYNHVSYIKQALDACLAQETSFDFEIIVCDDYSTDGTREILQEYAQKYPNIVLSLQHKNKKAGQNYIDGIAKVRGKYLAMCEGDDIWTVPHKLEKQVRFLEENPDFSVSCHRVEMTFEGHTPYAHHNQDAKPVYIYKDLNMGDTRIKDGVFYADEAIANYYFQTSSMVFRWRFVDGLPHWFRPYMFFDQFFFMLHAVEGKIKYFDECMSKWRRHTSGYTWLQNLNKGLFFQKKEKAWLRIYRQMDEFFCYRFHLQIRERILLALRHLTNHYTQTNQINKIKELYNNLDLQPFFHKPVLENAIIMDALRLAMPYDRTFFPPWFVNLHRKENEKKSKNKELKPLGGFPALAINAINEHPHSIWKTLIGDKEHACFAQGNQAIAVYLWAMGCNDVWIPNYTFNTYYAPMHQLNNKIYVVNQNLEPDICLINAIEPGDAIITHSYFGKPLNPEIEKALHLRDDIFWIHDAGASLPQKETSLAPIILYTPSELVGVPKCAFLVGKGVKNLQPLHKNIESEMFFKELQASVTRFETSHANTRDIIYAKSLSCKKQLPQETCSKLSIEMLKRIPIQEIFQKTIENWQYLHEKLGNSAFSLEHTFGKNGDNTQKAIPSAYAFEIPTQHAKQWPLDVLLTMLTNNNIFHVDLYTSMQSNIQIHTKNIALLPCDYQCDKEDLDRIIKVVQSYLSTTFNDDNVRAWT